jgi:hypothetical protein
MPATEVMAIASKAAAAMSRIGLVALQGDQA